jgi:hypothetical protein
MFSPLGGSLSKGQGACHAIVTAASPAGVCSKLEHTHKTAVAGLLVQGRASSVDYTVQAWQLESVRNGVLMCAFCLLLSMFTSSSTCSSGNTIAAHTYPHSPHLLHAYCSGTLCLTP